VKKLILIISPLLFCAPILKPMAETIRPIIIEAMAAQGETIKEGMREGIAEGLEKGLGDGLTRGIGDGVTQALRRAVREVMQELRGVFRRGGEADGAANEFGGWARRFQGNADLGEARAAFIPINP
jgi:hypothetical protein